MYRLLKITRKRSVAKYLHMLETASMKQGFEFIEIGSTRFNRLQLCVDSIERHILDNVYGEKI